MSSPTFFTAYASRAATEFSPSDLVELLRISRRNNERAGLSGLLLYRAGNFLQALEGSEAQVRETLLRISRDKRHRAVVTLSEGWHNERLFANWTMAFEDISDADPSEYPGLSDYLAGGDTGAPLRATADEEVFEFFRSFRDHL